MGLDQFLEFHPEILTDYIVDVEIVFGLLLGRGVFVGGYVSAIGSFQDQVWGGDQFVCSQGMGMVDIVAD